MRLSVVEQRTEDIYEILRMMANRGDLRPGRDILQYSSVVAGGGGAGLRSRERRARELSEARRKRDRADMEARTPYNVSIKIFTL